MNNCTLQRHELLKDRVQFLARRFAGSVILASQLQSLAGQLRSAPGEAADDVAARLRELSDISPKVRAAMEDYEQKASIDRAEGFLADLAEDRSSAPPEIVPLIDQYISRLRESISRSWDKNLSRRELDAHVTQVRLCYSRDLDRILQGLLRNVAG